MPMTYSRQRALLVALELAMKARLAEVDQMLLGRSVIAIGEAFPVGAPMRHAMRRFADAFPVTRRDGALLCIEGEALFEAIRREILPDLAARLDIEGWADGIYR